jgi:hypothetical protein
MNVMHYIFTLTLNGLKCPTCNRDSLQEFSSLAPALVQCADCGNVFELSFVRGYWQGYQAAGENGHEADRLLPGKR